MRDAQRQADKTNEGVLVSMRQQRTFIEPNLPPFTRKDIDTRFAHLLKEEKDEANNDSDSIIRPKIRNKLSKNRPKQSDRKNRIKKIRFKIKKIKKNLSIQLQISIGRPRKRCLLPARPKASTNQMKLYVNYVNVFFNIN